MSLFEPTSIAVVGASATEGKIGHDILNNLIEQGFEGEIFPINPKSDEILGKKTYASVADISSPVDLALIVVPASIVPTVLKECGEASIQNVVIISAGFGEVGTKEGDDLEKQVKEIAAEYSLNLVGPNCLGILRPSIKMNASFAVELPPEGNTALISQSGAMAVAVMDASTQLGIGYSLVASIGNKTVMNEIDFLRLAAGDDKTKVIGFYLESISNGQEFLKACMEVSAQKPIVILKSGTSEHGKKAAASHTGALAGNDAAIDALCSQSGALRARTMQEFIDLLEALESQPTLASDNIAIITNAGGPGILATDAAEKTKLAMPPLSESVEATLRTHLPDAASTKNPIDVIGDAKVDRYKAALDAVGEDPSIDGVAVLLTPQVMTPCKEIADCIIDWHKTHPSMPVVTSFMGDTHVEDAISHIQKHGIPCFETPERAVSMLRALRRTQPVSTYNPKEINDLRAAKAAEILEDQKGLVAEDVVQELFTLYSIPLPEQQLATTKEEAVSFAEEIGYPVIAKVSSPTILHKTDIGGIRANIKSNDEIEEAWDNIMKNMKTHGKENDVRGILVQQFLDAGHEFIVGATADADFGHLVMAGLGGIYAEMLEDTAFRIAPITQEEGYSLLQELKSWKLLLGMRGNTQLDIDAVASLLEVISQMVTECPQIKDIDLNPVFVRQESIVVADAKVVI